MKLTREKSLEISNKEILELKRQTEYNQVVKDNISFEISLSHKGLKYDDEPHIFWGEVQDTIRAKTFKGLTLNVSARTYENKEFNIWHNRLHPSYKNNIKEKDFNEFRDLEDKHNSLTLDVGHGSYLFKTAKDEYLFWSASSNGVNKEKLNTQEAKEKATRYYHSDNFNELEKQPIKKEFTPRKQEEAKEIIVLDTKITSKDFNELLPDQLKKDLQKMNQEKKKGFKPRARAKNSKVLDMQIAF